MQEFFLLPTRDPIRAVGHNVMSSYFETMGIPVLRGRTFEPSEDLSSDVVVVNAEFARAYFPNAEVVGRQFYSRIFGPEKVYRVVGVVGDTIESFFDDSSEPTIYLPGFFNIAAILIRTRQPSAVIGPMQEFVRHIDRTIPMSQAELLDDTLHGPLGSTKTQLLVSVVLAVASILLATAGLYGLVRRNVESRRREDAIRFALGATGRQVVLTRLIRTMRPIGYALVCGMIMAVLSGKLVQSALFRVPATDPVILGASAASLAAVAVLTSFVGSYGVFHMDAAALLRSY